MSSISENRVRGQTYADCVRAIQDCLDALEVLKKETSDSDQIVLINNARIALRKEEGEIIKKELSESNEEYVALSEDINDSVQKLEKLKRKLEKIADTFESAARALSLLKKVLGFVARFAV